MINYQSFDYRRQGERRRNVIVPHSALMLLLINYLRSNLMLYFFYFALLLIAVCSCLSCYVFLYLMTCCFGQRDCICLATIARIRIPVWKPSYLLVKICFHTKFLESISNVPPYGVVSSWIALMPWSLTLPAIAVIGRLNSCLIFIFNPFSRTIYELNESWVIAIHSR